LCVKTVSDKVVTIHWPNYPYKAISHCCEYSRKKSGVLHLLVLNMLHLLVLL